MHALRSRVFLALVVGVALLLAGPAVAIAAEQDGFSRPKMAQPLEVDVYWSMRSPYCYIALDRILEMQKKYNVKMNLRPVWRI